MFYREPKMEEKMKIIKRYKIFKNNFLIYIVIYLIYK